MCVLRDNPGDCVLLSYGKNEEQPKDDMHPTLPKSQNKIKMSLNPPQRAGGRFQEWFEDEDLNIDDYIYEEVPANRSTIMVGDTKYTKDDELPVQLIKKKHNGEFEVNSEALELVSSYDKPAAFVCLAGKYRTGKSFLLNKLIGLKGKGFKVSSSTDACTEGIWMWSRPIYNQKMDCLIFIIDTQGSEATNRNAQHDAKIFTLGILISSYFIYNSVGAIDQQSINELNLVATLSKSIASNSSISEQSLHRYMPKFLWLLRDFVLEVRDESGRQLSPTEYLENCLSTKKGSENTKDTKKALMTVFRDRECMMMVRPADDEKDLKNLDHLPEGKLRGEFKDAVNSLRNKILTNACPKVINGEAVTAPLLCRMMETYVSSINHGAIPNITSAWNHIEEEVALEAYDAAIEVYNQKYGQYFGQDSPKQEEYMKRALKEMRDEALDAFDYNLESSNQKLRNKLKNFLDDKEKTIILINEEFNQAYNIRLLTECSQQLVSNVQNGGYSDQNAEELNEDLKRLIATYNEDARGARKCEVLTLFLTNFHAMILKSYNDSSKQKVKKLNNNQEQAQKLQVEYLQQMRVMEERLESARQQLDTKESRADRELKEEKRKLEEARTQNLSIRKQLDALAIKNKKTKCCFF